MRETSTHHQATSNGREVETAIVHRWESDRVVTAVLRRPTDVPSDADLQALNVLLCVRADGLATVKFQKAGMLKQLAGSTWYLLAVLLGDEMMWSHLPVTAANVDTVAEQMARRRPMVLVLSKFAEVARAAFVTTVSDGIEFAGCDLRDGNSMIVRTKDRSLTVVQADDKQWADLEPHESLLHKQLVCIKKADNSDDAPDCAIDMSGTESPQEPAAKENNNDDGGIFHWLDVMFGWA